MNRSVNGSISRPIQIFQIVVYTPTFIFGFILNICAIWILLTKIKKWTTLTIYLVNLILNDCLLLFTLPFKIHAYKVGMWSLGRLFCSFLESLHFVNIYGSILIITCIAFDRYLAIRHPFSARALRSPLKAALVCGVVWIILFSASTESYKNTSNRTSCFYGFSHELWKKLWLVLIIEVVFVGSAIIMTFCSVEIIRTLTNRNTKLDWHKLRNSKSIKIVLANLLTFLVCFIPYHVAVFLYFLVKNKLITTNSDTPRNIVIVTMCISSINCLLDALCYYFILKEHWKINSKDATAEREVHSKLFASILRKPKDEPAEGISLH
ncbi:lysophosphatidic acid receptor 6-like [Polypterus senegalus]|uniref:lysophosphatidic acid receptor 6-like n=1 Tax=Polypterus senegalus TaxID=55291 RepID=UPI001964FAFF|nr:lysophosphatidic acid receptor 6-like [Polypterus senegalus]